MLHSLVLADTDAGQVVAVVALEAGTAIIGAIVAFRSGHTGLGWANILLGLFAFGPFLIIPTLIISRKWVRHGGGLRCSNCGGYKTSGEGIGIWKEPDHLDYECNLCGYRWSVPYP